MIRILSCRVNKTPVEVIQSIIDLKKQDPARGAHRSQKMVGAAHLDHHPKTESGKLCSFVVIDMTHVSF